MRQLGFRVRNKTSRLNNKNKMFLLIKTRSFLWQPAIAMTTKLLPSKVLTLMRKETELLMKYLARHVLYCESHFPEKVIFQTNFKYLFWNFEWWILNITIFFEHNNYLLSETSNECSKKYLIDNVKCVLFMTSHPWKCVVKNEGC